MRHRGHVLVFWFQIYVVSIHFCFSVVAVCMVVSAILFYLLSSIILCWYLWSFAILLFELFIDGMFLCLDIRIIRLSEHNFLCMSLLVLWLFRLVLLVLIDEFFVAFISAWVGLSVVGDFSKNVFTLVTSVAFTVGFRPYSVC